MSAKGNTLATEVTTGSGAIYSFAYFDGVCKVKRVGTEKLRDLNWRDLIMYPSIEIGKPLILIIVGDNDNKDEFTVRWTTPVQSILTGRQPS